MKILFPVVDSESHKEVLASGFQETNNICIFDPETYAFKHMDVAELGNVSSLPNALQDLNVSSIISTKIRPMALQILKRSGLKVYQASGTDVNENLELFRDGYLEPYSMSSSRELLACGGSCTSCSSTSCS